MLFAKVSENSKISKSRKLHQDIHQDSNERNNIFVFLLSCRKPKSGVTVLGRSLSWVCRLSSESHPAASYLQRRVHHAVLWSHISWHIPR